MMRDRTKAAQKALKDRLGPAPKDQKKNVLKNTPLPKNKSLPKKGNSNDSGNVGSRDRSGSSSSRRSAPRSPVARIERRAKRLTNGIIRPEVADLKDQRREVNVAADQALENSETLYNRGVGDINHVGSQTQQFLASMQAQNQGMHDTTAVQQQAAAAALQGQLGGIYSNAAGGVNSELDALGINNGQFTGQMNSDQAFQQGQAAQAGVNTQANLGLSSQNASLVGGLLQGMNAGSMQSAHGQNLNRMGDSQVATEAERSSQLDAVRDAISEAKGSRKDVFLELMTQLENSGWAESLRNRSKNSGQNGNSASANNGRTTNNPRNDGPDKKAVKTSKNTGRAYALSEVQLNNYDNKTAKAVRGDKSRTPKRSKGKTRK